MAMGSKHLMKKKTNLNYKMKYIDESLLTSKGNCWSLMS